MDTNEKDTHGLDTLYPIPELDSGDGNGTSSPRFAIAAWAPVISSTILSLGAAASMFEFVYLSFAHPDAANILIPIVIAPIVSLISHVLERRRNVRSGK